jgi:hypothetical protein
MPEAFSLKQFGFQKPLNEYDMQQLSEIPIIHSNMYNQFQPFNPPTSPMRLPVQQQAAPVYGNTESLLETNKNNEGIFRNNPNNPFFGIPTSMDWSEWNEWSQNNKGSADWRP